MLVRVNDFLLASVLQKKRAHGAQCRKSLSFHQRQSVHIEHVQMLIAEHKNKTNETFFKNFFLCLAASVSSAFISNVPNQRGPGEDLDAC